MYINHCALGTLLGCGGRFALQLTFNDNMLTCLAFQLLLHIPAAMKPNRAICCSTKHQGLWSAGRRAVEGGKQ